MRANDERVVEIVAKMAERLSISDDVGSKCITDLLDDRTEYIDALEATEKVLHLVEWSYEYNEYNMQCPICRAEEWVGDDQSIQGDHDIGCALAQAITLIRKVLQEAA